MEVRGGVTLVDNGRRRTTECEDRARILGSRVRNLFWVNGLSHPESLYWVQRGTERFHLVVLTLSASLEVKK